MRAHRGHVLAGRLAVRESRKQRRHPLALGSRLDARHAIEEAAPPLADAAVDLRVGPAGLVADLLVRVALRPQQQAADLLRLEPAHRLDAEAQPLEPLRLLVSGRHEPAASLRVAHQLSSLTLLADRERLVLDHCLSYI